MRWTFGTGKRATCRNGIDQRQGRLCNVADQFSSKRGRLPRRGRLRALLREDKVFQIFWKADQASKQDQRISRIRLAASSTSVTLGMVEIIAKIILGHRELLFNSFNLSTACTMYPLTEVRTMNDDLMIWPWSDEWTDIGGEG